MQVFFLSNVVICKMLNSGITYNMRKCCEKTSSNRKSSFAVSTWEESSTSL